MDFLSIPRGVRMRLEEGDASSTGSASASTSGGGNGDDDLGFWMLLSGREVSRPTHPPPDGKRARVVLLHGWLMNHTCWLNTATQLRDRYGHDVLLLDFHGHGKSPRLSHYSRHTPEACAAQLRRVLLRVGWAHDGVDDDPHALHPDDPDSNPTPRVPLVLCGLSLGGVVSCLYADAHPRDVGRVILVSSPGLPERWWMPPNVTRPVRLALLAVAAAADRGSIWTGGPIGRWFVRRFPPAAAALSHVSLIRDTPTFGVPEDMPQRLKRLGTPLVLVWGALDQFHTPQIRRWKAGRPHAARVAGNGEDAGVQILVHPWFDHFAACALLDKLELARRPHFWHDAPIPPIRSRL